MAVAPVGSTRIREVLDVSRRSGRRGCRPDRTAGGPRPGRDVLRHSRPAASPGRACDGGSRAIAGELTASGAHRTATPPESDLGHPGGASGGISVELLTRRRLPNSWRCVSRQTWQHHAPRTRCCSTLWRTRRDVLARRGGTTTESRVRVPLGFVDSMRRPIRPLPSPRVGRRGEQAAPTAACRPYVWVPQRSTATTQGTTDGGGRHEGSHLAGRARHAGRRGG